MKKALIALSAALLLATSLIPATAAKPVHKAPPKPAIHKKVVSAICPVMGTKIPDVTKAAGKSVYKGKTYYFCCKGCKPAFDKNPAKYIKSKKK